MARKEHGNPLLKQLIKERGIKDLQGIHVNTGLIFPTFTGILFPIMLSRR